MNQRLVDQFMKMKPELRKRLKEKHPEDYLELVKLVFETISTTDFGPDPRGVIELTCGSYHGSNLYVTPDISQYNEIQFWMVKIAYGSCSACDTLQSIHKYDYNDTPTKKQIDDYLELALHIVQKLKGIDSGLELVDE